MQYYGQSGSTTSGTGSTLTPYAEGMERLGGVFSTNADKILKSSEGALYPFSDKQGNRDILEGDILFSITNIKEAWHKYPHMQAVLNGAFKEARALFPGDEKKQLEYVNSLICVTGVATQHRSYDALSKGTTFSYASKGVVRLWAHKPLAFGAPLVAVAPSPKLTKSQDWKTPPDTPIGRITMTVEAADPRATGTKFLIHMSEYLNDKEEYTKNFVSKTKDPSVSVKRVAALESSTKAALVNGLVMIDMLVKIGLIEPIKLKNPKWKGRELVVAFEPSEDEEEMSTKETLVTLANLLGVFGENMQTPHGLVTDEHIEFGAEASRQISMAQFYDGEAANLSFGHDHIDNRNMGTNGPNGMINTNNPYGRLNDMQLNANRGAVAGFCDWHMDSLRNYIGTSLRSTDPGYFPAYVNIM